MTKEEREKRHNWYFTGLHVSTGPTPGCHQCGTENWSDHNDLGYIEHTADSGVHFSSHPCEVCNSSLAGDRVPWHGTDIAGAADDIIHGTCCLDCRDMIEGAE